MSTLRSLKLQGTARSQLVPLDLCRGPIRTVTRRFGRTVARAPGHSHEYAKLPEWAKWGFVDEIGQVTVERSAYPCHPLQLKALRTSQSSRPGVPDMPLPPHPHLQSPGPCSPQLSVPTLSFPLRPTDLTRARLSNPPSPSFNHAKRLLRNTWRKEMINSRTKGVGLGCLVLSSGDSAGHGQPEVTSQSQV